MKKLEVNYSYLSEELIKAIAILFKDGFRESDVITFEEIYDDLDARIRFELDGKLFFVRKGEVEDILDGKYDEDILTPPKEDDEICEGDYCEN